MKKTGLTIMLLVAALSGFTPKAWGQDVSKQAVHAITTEKFDGEIAKQISKLMKAYKVEGLSVALVDDQQVAWAKGFGLADKAQGVPATPHTVYRVGSISKLLTATAIMQLHEQKKIELDAPIQKYIPDFSIKSRFSNQDPITARNLLTHHSGLPADYFSGFFTKNPEPYYSVITKLKNSYVPYPPNYVFSYSNLGYSLLGYMVEKASGQPFTDYVQTQILEPIQMRNSSFVLKPALEKQFAKAYKGGQEEQEPDIRDVPAGMLHASATDLGNFMKMMFNSGVYQSQAVLQATTVKEMLTPQNKDIPLDIGAAMGLGWFLSEPGVNWNYAGGIAQHGGDTYLYHSHLLMLPKHKLEVVVLSNSKGGQYIVNSIAKRIIREALAQKTGLKLPVGANSKKPNLIRVKSTDLKKYEGYYLVNTSELLKFESRKGRLETIMSGQKIQLMPNDQGGFALRIKLLKLIPITLRSQRLKFSEVNGQQLLVGEENGASIPFGTKVNPSTIISANWQQRIGQYKLIAGQEDFVFRKNVSLQNKEGILLLNFTDEDGITSSLPLNTLSNTEAVILGLGRSVGETVSVSNTEAGDEMLHFHGYTFKRIKRPTTPL